jgi:hypothetical protein
VRYPPPPAPGPLLLRLSHEVATCAHLLSAIESEVAGLIQSVPVRDHPTPGALQKIDLLAQMLGDLSACLAGLGKGPFPAPAAADWADPALGALRLDDLRRRLTGQGARQDPARHDVDFF